MAKKQESSSKILSDAIIKALKDKKGVNIVRLDLREIKSAIAEYFIVATGTSDRHVMSLADGVVDDIHQALNEKPVSKEGLRLGEWALLDYVTVVVHIFLEEKREFYSIEELWSDGVADKVEKKKRVIRPKAN